MGLTEFFVLLFLVILIIGIIVAIMKTGSGKLTQRAIDHLVKMECVEATGNRGDFDISLSKIEQSILDVLTQGYTLENFSAKVKWRKRGNKCVYVIELTGTNDDGDTVTRESSEFEVDPCP